MLKITNIKHGGGIWRFIVFISKASSNCLHKCWILFWFSFHFFIIWFLIRLPCHRPNVVAKQNLRIFIFICQRVNVIYVFAWLRFSFLFAIVPSRSRSCQKKVPFFLFMLLLWTNEWNICETCCSNKQKYASSSLFAYCEPEKLNFCAEENNNRQNICSTSAKQAQGTQPEIQEDVWDEQ